MPRSLHSKATRQRIVAAAADAFARHGYESALIRSICRAANANIAAVNYHFGSKAELFRHALEYAAMFGSILSRGNRKGQHGLSPRRRLEAWVRALHGKGRSSWLWRIAAHESCNPGERSRLLRLHLAVEVAALRSMLAAHRAPRPEAEGIEPDLIAVLAVCFGWDSVRRLTIGDGASDLKGLVTWLTAYVVSDSQGQA